ncbi:unnamed protein product [Blepharisma stoltei]|uniref:Uncharacterized protein n=1 Tax=Blepharisma stoltei TaxID=1481888 RepID=A0AAU9J8U6_9CILI|nr:unnamed protein product [Blepharisma stoltei]
MEEPEIALRTHSQTIFSLQDKIKQAISSFPYWEIENEKKNIEEHDSRADKELFLPNISEKILVQPNATPIVDEKEANEATEVTEPTERDNKPEAEHYKAPLKMSIAQPDSKNSNETNQEKGCCCILF